MAIDYDVQGALAAGITLPQIADYLGQRAQFDVASARKAGHSDVDIIGSLAGSDAIEGLQGGTGDLSRGAQTALGQTVPTLKGVAGLIGATAEKAFGEGGVSTALKNWGLNGYKAGMEKIQPLSRDTDELTTALDKAKQGNLGALVDWATWAVGYGLGQIGESAAMAVVGGVAGAAMAPEAAPVTGAAGAVTGLVAKGAVKDLAQGMIEKAVVKEANRLMAQSGGKLAAEAATKQATKAVAASIGKGGALMGWETGMELGSIYADAEAQARKEGRQLDGADLARVWGTGILAGGVGAVGDKIGLDAVTGKLSSALPGGRLARTAGGAMVAGTSNSAEESVQTMLERFGAGKEVFSPEGVNDIINAAGAGFMGSAPAGAFGGIISRQRQDVAVEKGKATLDQDLSVGGAQKAIDAAAAELRGATDAYLGGVPPAAPPAAPAAAPVDLGTGGLLPKQLAAMQAAGLSTQGIPTRQTAVQPDQTQTAAPVVNAPPKPSGRPWSPEAAEFIAESATGQPQGATGQPGGATPEQLRMANLRTMVDRDSELTQKVSGGPSDAVPNRMRADAVAVLKESVRSDDAAELIENDPKSNAAALQHAAQLRRHAQDLRTLSSNLEAKAETMAAKHAAMQPAGTQFERDQAAAQRAVNLEKRAPAKVGEASNLVDLTPMTSKEAMNRLNVLRDMIANEGGNALGLAIVPHPSQKGKFAIGQRELPSLKLDPIEQPVNEAETQARLETAALTGKEQARRDEDKQRQDMISRARANIEARGGVASPYEAQLLLEANQGQPYDSIDPSLGRPASPDQVLTARTGILVGSEAGLGYSAPESKTPRQEEAPRSDLKVNVRQRALPSDADTVVQARLEHAAAQGRLAAAQTDELQRALGRPAGENPVEALRNVPGNATTPDDIKQLVDAANQRRDAAETAEIERMLVDDEAQAKASANAVALASQDETATAKARQIAVKARENLVTHLLERFAEPNGYFASAAIKAINKQLSVLQREPLSKGERARIDALLGRTRAFFEPNLPADKPLVIDRGADNSSMERLIKPQPTAESIAQKEDELQVQRALKGYEAGQRPADPLAGIKGETTTQADVQQLVAAVRSEKDAAETAEIERMLAEDAKVEKAKADAVRQASDNETAQAKAQELADAARRKLVDHLVERFAEPNGYFASGVIQAVNKQLSVLGREPLSKGERAGIDDLLGRTRAFLQPNLPSAPERVEDRGADNAAMENLIPERGDKGPAGTPKPKVPRPSKVGGVPTEQLTDEQLSATASNDQLPAITRRGATVELQAREEERQEQAPAAEEQAPATVESLMAETRRYHSGMSATGDQWAAGRATGGQALGGVGVEVGSLTSPGIKALAHNVVVMNTSVFVDSGAFGAFNKGRVLSFDRVLAKYDQISDAIFEVYEEEGEPNYPRPLFVMPDVIGDQAASLALIEKHKDWITAELDGDTSRLIIPIQKGDLPMAEAYRQIVETLGGRDNFIVGIPSNKEAISAQEFEAFLAEAQPRAVHILGAAATSKLAGRLQSIINADLAGKINITADASTAVQKRRNTPVPEGSTRSQELEKSTVDFNDPGVTGEKTEGSTRASNLVNQRFEADLEETRTGMEVDAADAEALREALRTDTDPATGKPIQSQGRRNELATELENLEGSVATAEEALAQAEEPARKLPALQPGNRATPSQQKAWLLERIDEAMTDALPADETISSSQARTTNGKREFSVYKGEGPDRIVVTVTEGANTWRMDDPRLPSHKRVLTPLHFFTATDLGDARKQAERAMQWIERDGKNLVKRDAPKVTFAVPNSGIRYTVVNTVPSLQSLRKKIEASPGFQDSPRRPAAEQNPGVQRGSASAKAAIENMIDEGDAQAAVDYAAHKGLDLAQTLKNDPARLKQVEGLTPTADEEETPAPKAEDKPYKNLDLSFRLTWPQVIAAYQKAATVIRGKTWTSNLQTRLDDRLKSALKEAGLQDFEADWLVFHANTVHNRNSTNSGAMMFLSAKELAEAAVDIAMVADPKDQAKLSTQRTGTVQDGETQHSYTVVDGLTNQSGLTKVLREIARVFGKQVVFFQSDTLKADGFVRPDNNQVVHLNADSKMSPVAVLGHELMHLFKMDNPTAYRAIATVLARQVDDKGRALFRADYGLGANMEELSADLLGNAFQDPGFLASVFAEIGATAPEGQARSIVQRLVAALNNAIAAALKVIQDMGVQPGFKADMIVKDLQAVRSALRLAMVEYGKGQREQAQDSAQEETSSGEMLASRQREQDQTETPAFKRWFKDSIVREPMTSSKQKLQDMKPLVVYHSTNVDFDQFQVGRETINSTTFGDITTQRQGIFFAEDPKFAEGYGTGQGQRVMPVYLSIQNPIYLDDGISGEDLTAIVEASDGKINRNDFRGVNADEMWQVFDGNFGRNFVEAAKSLGYDGAYMIESDPDTGDSQYVWVAFDPAQIKSATGNQGTFDPTNPDITMSRQRIFGDSGRTYTPEQLQMFQNVGRSVEEPTIKERIASLRKDLGKKLAQGIFDQFAPLKDLDRKAYQLARLSKGASGAMDAMLHHGKLSIRDGVYDADMSGGVLERLGVPLHGEFDDFLSWVAGNRAERLATEDRENLFTPADILAAKSLANGTTNFDYTLQHGANAGQVTRDRSLIYADALKTFNEFHKNALDMAEQSGLIDRDARQIWENEFYVPFHRVSEEGFIGDTIKGGLVRQQAIKTLKGGTDKLNDLMANTLLNWAHLIDAAAKNRAALASLESAQQMGVAVEASEDIARQMAKAMGIKSQVVWAMEDGKKRFFVVEDKAMLQAITSLQYAGLKGPIMDALSTFKHVLTVGVTASPAFKIRNLARDSVQAIASAPLSYNLFKNLAEGYKASDPNSQTYVSALASGGLIRFGTMVEGNEAARTRQLIKMGIKDSTILNSQSKIDALWTKMEKGFMAYQELGNRGEEINRAALYKQLIDQGVPHGEASLMARDLMDFSLQGTFTTVRFLSQVVPFLNARLQGLYKLGRASKEDPRRFAAVFGAVALASVSLMLAYQDDDDWKKREDWDRNNYWWFKVGGLAYRIPKPFEIGAMATLAERGLEYFINPEMTGKRMYENVRDIVMDQLSMNPIPQAVKPILDIYSNKDSFSGRPIESMGMDRLRPDYRYTGNTSMLARGVSTAGQAVASQVNGQFLSPVQIDHLLHGYFSWLGSFVVGATDMALRPLTGQAERPAADYWKVATQGIVQEANSPQSRYVSQMYQQAKEVEQVYSTWNMLRKQGRLEEASQFLEANADSIQRYKRVEGVKERETKINERIRMIERSSMSAADKKAQITGLQGLRDQTARLLTQ